jgi:hypothetical protein
MTALDLDKLTLGPGSHPPGSRWPCVMEAVAMLAGEQWTDHPQCASPVIGAFLRTWNDGLPDDDRQQLKQYIPRLVGSKGTQEQEEQRAWLATDWLVRVQTPAWLRLAGLTDQADLLAQMQPLNADTCPSILPALKAVRSDAAAARDAAGAAAGDAAWAAAGDAAWAAAGDAAWAAAGAAAWAAAGAAAGDAARAAAWAAAWAAAGAAAGDAARAAAWAAAGDAAWAAAWAALEPTKNELQAAAHQLVDAMLAITEDVPA